MSKKQSRISSSNDKSKGIGSPLKGKKLVISAYKSVKESKAKDLGTSILESKLE
jgi:hypothetical protein